MHLKNKMLSVQEPVPRLTFVRATPEAQKKRLSRMQDQPSDEDDDTQANDSSVKDMNPIPTPRRNAPQSTPSVIVTPFITTETLAREPVKKDDVVVQDPAVKVLRTGSATRNGNPGSLDDHESSTQKPGGAIAFSDPVCRHKYEKKKKKYANFMSKNQRFQR